MLDDGGEKVSQHDDNEAEAELNEDATGETDDEERATARYCAFQDIVINSNSICDLFVDLVVYLNSILWKKSNQFHPTRPCFSSVTRTSKTNMFFSNLKQCDYHLDFESIAIVFAIIVHLVTLCLLVFYSQVYLWVPKIQSIRNQFEIEYDVFSYLLGKSHFDFLA